LMAADFIFAYQILVFQQIHAYTVLKVVGVFVRFLPLLH
jgi:hypothetical protein